MKRFPGIARKTLAALTLSMTLSALPAAEAADWKKHVWKTSLAVLGTATLVDAHSSWGRQELNPALRGPDGRFGAQGVSLKVGLAAGAALGQYFTMRRIEKAYGKDAANRGYLSFTVANFATGAAFGAVAARNYSLK